MESRPIIFPRRHPRGSETTEGSVHFDDVAWGRSQSTGLKGNHKKMDSLLLAGSISWVTDASLRSA